MPEPVPLSKALAELMDSIPKPIIQIIDPKDLQQAYEGSWFTIVGAGGDLMDWVNGINAMLEEEGIGKPQQWYSTIGCHVNTFAGSIPRPDRDYFPHDLSILLFSLDGLDMGKLAVWRLRTDGRWFDDVIQNMRR